MFDFVVLVMMCIDGTREFERHSSRAILDVRYRRVATPGRGVSTVTVVASS